MPKLNIYICIGFVFSYFSSQNQPAQAQQSTDRFQRYTTRDGLSSGLLYDIVQDKIGWIWVSSSLGLNRFDGKTFTQFTHDESDSTSLPSDNSRIITDKAGTLWAYSEKGLCWFNPPTRQFIAIKGLGGRAVGCAGSDEYNNLWIFTENGWLWKLTSKSSLPEKKHFLEGISVNQIISLRGSEIMLATSDGLIQYDGKTGKLIVYKEDRPGSANNYFSVFKDDKGHIWASSWGEGIKKLEMASGKLTRYLYNNMAGNDVKNYAAAIIQQGNELWISTVDPEVGIAVFNTQTSSFTRTIDHNPADPLSISGNASISIFKDKSGIVWYATENGLNKYDPLANRFNALKLDEVPGCGTEQGLSTLMAVNHTWWVGTSDRGILVLDSSGKKLLQSIVPGTISKQNESNYINAFGLTKEGEILIGTFIGAFTCNTQTFQTKLIQSLASEKILAILTDNRTASYWFATNNGIKILAADLKTLRTTLLAGITVNCLYQQKNGTIWMGTSQGLYSWEGNKLFKTDQNSETYRTMANARIYSISEDGTGNLLIASSSGVLVYNPEKKQLNRYAKQNGLPHHFCYGISADSSGQYWVLHEKGLSKIDPITRRVVNYGEAQGISSPTFAGGFLYPASNGNIYFGRYISIYHFSPKALMANSYRAPVAITSIRAGDSILPTYLNSRQQPLKLSYKNNRLSIEFALLNYSNSEGNTYQYKLQKNEATAWTDLGNRNQINFSELTPGSYHFSVRGISPDGVLSSNEAGLSFEVVPPFWQTLWFKLILGLMLGLLVAGVVFLRFRALRQKAAIRQQMLEAEVKALRAQMNPHFIFNCMNTLDSFILQNRQLEASTLVQRFSKLTRRVLEHTAKTNISLAEEFETLRLYLQIEKLRQSASFDFELKAAPETQHLLLPPMLIQPFVENAVIHGMRNRKESGGKVGIYSEKAGNLVKITIEDNGVGREKAMAIKAAQPHGHQSLSMELTLSRLEALHGHQRHEEYLVFTDITGAQTGTRVDIFIPLENFS